MTFTEAAAEVLRLAGKPMHYKEITELAIEKNLLSHVGKSPEVTMGARLAALLKKEDKTNPIVRVKPGVFALREWEKKRGGAKAAEVAPDDSDDTEVNALEVAAAALDADEDEDKDEVRPVLDGEHALRADLAATGADVFADEDDDDQPIFASPASTTEPAGDAGADGGRRRRRRRRRGRGGREGVGEAGEERASSPRFDEGEENGEVARDPLAPAPRPMVRERHQIMGAPEMPGSDGDELSGRDLADAAVMTLSATDRNQGPVPLRSIADALSRRGRLGSDGQLAMMQLSASLRADNALRQSNGQRPRFRFAQGPRVALTDWSLTPDLVRLEQEASSAIERYREAARRVFLRRLQELPSHAFLELVLVGLERAGLTQLRAVRRAGAPGGEAHFAGIRRIGLDDVPTALVLRKDGREIGRERVSDLRGALHHYGPAATGWLLTTGQVLSGAREEAAAPNAAPIALFDGAALCRILEENDTGVVRTHHTTAIPDLELLEQLRG